MKKIIFFVYVFAKVVNVSCNELDVTSIGFEDCLLGIINQNFVEDRTICFINDESYNLTVPNKLSNPYIVVNIDKNTLLSLKCQHNFVIFTKNLASLTELMRSLMNSVLWSTSSSPRSKFLVITDESDLSKIFRKLFYYYIIDLIVMVPSNTSNHMVYVSNPFEDGNNCGRYFSVVFKQSCSATTLNLIQIPLKNLGGCPITYYRNTVNTVTALRNMVLLVLEELGFRINATIGEQGSKLFNNIKLTPYYDFVSVTSDYTKIMYRDNWMWLTPSPIRVFPIETLVELFQSEVWIFTGFTFVLIVIVWWSAVLLKNSTNKLEQFSQVFIDILSLSLPGTINLIPKTKTLCYLLLIYSLYVMVIQTAYKTNLIYVLTLPQYSNRITSSKEIIQQKLPVYALGVIYAIFLKRDSDFKPLLNLCNTHSQCMDSIYNYRNSVLMMPEVVFSSIVTKDENSVENKFNFFIDNHQIGMLPIVFLLQKGHYILANLNKIITELEESGIYHYKYKGKYHQKELVEENVPLNMMHIILKATLIVIVFLKYSSTYKIKLKNGVRKMKSIAAYICMIIKVLNINCILIEENGANYKDCLLAVIRQNFEENATLCFITSENYQSVLFSELTNPYVLLNINKPIILTQQLRNFVILVKNSKSLANLVQVLNNSSSIWNDSYSRKGKYVVITYEEEIPEIFETLWIHGVIDVVVMVPGFTKNHTLYTSNPFQDGNLCGRRSSIISNQSCDAALEKSVKIPLTNLHKCEITLNNILASSYSLNGIIFVILKELSRTLNGTFILHDLKENAYYTISIYIYFNNQASVVDRSKILYSQNWLWISPPPVRVFPIDTIIMLFQIEVWILTGLIFVFSAILWWAIVKSRTVQIVQLSHAFLTVASLTICGTINSIPKIKMLCYVFLIYSFYATVIQTAFKTNLIYLLTLPEYSNKISTVKEVIRMKLPVYVPYMLFDHVLKYNYSDENTYSQLQKLLIRCVHSNKCANLPYNYRNSAMLMSDVEFFRTNLDEKQNYNTFIDNSVIGNIKIYLVMLKGHYFIENINKIITNFEESGILQREVKRSYPVIKQSLNETVVVLNMHHLYSVFLLLIVGLMLSSAVFILEYFHSKYNKNKD
ncbi:hypothetical protein FQA39_LY08135 [Lamprigera yunnana]|nr:hypothetical protein FQA39_LY08135 [Lamprigera yunnana]